MNRYSNICEYYLVVFDKSGQEITQYRPSHKFFFDVYSKNGRKITSIDGLLKTLESFRGKCSRFEIGVTFCSSELVANTDSSNYSVHYKIVNSKAAAAPTKAEENDFEEFVEAIASSIDVPFSKPYLGSRGYVGFDVEDHLGHIMNFRHHGA